jgi:diadenosine tetraphosphatase ApaH/serine/threonine PP2A family protein phosphatase
MPIAVLSDIHSNQEALQVFLDFASKKGIKDFICLGDIVGYGASPNECLTLLSKLPNLICVAGNHDYGVIGKTDIRYFNVLAQTAIIWTRNQLSQKLRSFLENLPLATTYNEAFLVHATPKDPSFWHYLFDLDDVREQFGCFTEFLCFIGHSHIPVMFSYEEKNKKVSIIREKQVKLQKGFRYIVNVGSIGQPRDGDPRLSFVIWDQEIQAIEFYRLEYDIVRAQQKIINASLPLFLALRLGVGQ